MSDADVLTKNLDTNLKNVSAEDLIKEILGFMFDADNDTLTLASTIEYPDKTTTTVKYEVKLIEIEG